jgi:tetratricopeptide (TPR) repeat protein
VIEQPEGGESRAGARRAAVVGIAMRETAREASVAAEARVFLREQTELSRFQRSTLDEEASRMERGDIDLALAKFEEANKYAANWGRLHLKWGEALTYTGRKDEAPKQFALAAALDLSTTDRTALAKWTKVHG